MLTRVCSCLIIAIDGIICWKQAIPTHITFKLVNSTCKENAVQMRLQDESKKGDGWMVIVDAVDVNVADIHATVGTGGAGSPLCTDGQVDPPDCTLFAEPNCGTIKFGTTNVTDICPVLCNACSSGNSNGGGGGGGGGGASRIPSCSAVLQAVEHTYVQ